VSSARPQPAAPARADFLLDARVVSQSLAGSPLRIEIADRIDSTNAELLRRAAAGDVHGLLFAAQQQDAGRGRRGRTWIPTDGLTFSLGWRFERPVAALSTLPLAAGVAMARALEAEGARGVMLKWPNDLVHAGAKLGGILVETASLARAHSTAVIGIGINLRIDLEARAHIGQPVTDLASITGGTPPERNRLLVRAARELALVLDAYAREGFAPLHDEWQRRHVLHARAVDVLMPDGRVVSGVVAGIDARGTLLVDCDDARRAFDSADISLRSAS
jgi:BirA family biotin operon repressor/biotin-[acetyl-CoA-carboxylase] ligase